MAENTIFGLNLMGLMVRISNLRNAAMKISCLRLTVAFLLLLAFRISAAVLYVDLNSTNPVPPYADWSTAATNIQNAINAANSGDVVLV